MLDIKRIRENLEDIKKAMDRRGEKEFNLDEVVELDDKRKELLKEVEVLKNKMNVESKKFNVATLIVSSSLKAFNADVNALRASLLSISTSEASIKGRQ